VETKGAQNLDELSPNQLFVRNPYETMSVGTLCFPIGTETNAVKNAGYECILPYFSKLSF